MKFDNKTFQQKYEAWKNGADYWKDIRGINLGGDTQAEEPSPEEQQQMDQNVQSILNAYNEGKDENIAEDIIKPLPFDTPLNEEHPILHKYKGGKNDSINTFVNRMGPLVGQQLNRYGYGDATFYNVMRQLAYESNYGRSRVARQQHNYGGVGWNGKTYNTYKSDADFVKDYVRLMHTRYGAALRAKSTQDYARALKQKGYYQDSLENYSRNLRGMDSLVKAAYYHRNAHKDAYNYNVQFDDLAQDYEDAKNASPIIINSPSTKQPGTIRADVPATLLGPTQEEIKAQQQRDLNKYKQQMYDNITQPSLPNILNLLPQNNFGKDSYGQKFWWRRGNNLHFKGGKDEVSNEGINRPEDKQQISWMRNWLKARKNILKKNAEATTWGYEKYSARDTSKPVGKMGWDSKYYSNIWNPITYLEGSNPTDNRVNKIIYSQVENAMNVPKVNVGNEYHPYGGEMGVYVDPNNWDNSGHYVAFNGTPRNEVKVHEFTHASHPEQQERYINDVIFNKNTPNVVDGHNNSSIDNARELYGALQEFRYKNKLKPNQVINQKYINSHRKLFNGTYLENISDKNKIRLFNEVAQYELNKNNDTFNYYA